MVFCMHLPIRQPVFRNLSYMNRLLLHISFWVAYLIQDTLLAFLWDSSRMHELAVAERVFMAFQLCVALLPPKILFTYLLLYVLLDRVLRQSHRWRYIFLLIAAVMLTLLTVRAIEVFFIIPVVFHPSVPTRPYFY